MANFDDSNSGFLMKNDKKEVGSKQPDYTGKQKVDGVEYDLSAWIRESKAGRKFFSISIKPPFKKEDKQAEISKQSIDFDGIPF